MLNYVKKKQHDPHTKSISTQSRGMECMLAALCADFSLAYGDDYASEMMSSFSSAGSGAIVTLFSRASQPRAA